MRVALPKVDKDRPVSGVIFSTSAKWTRSKWLGDARMTLFMTFSMRIGSVLVCVLSAPTSYDFRATMS
jgi:hypothetical protein